MYLALNCMHEEDELCRSWLRNVEISSGSVFEDGAAPYRVREKKQRESTRRHKSRNVSDFVVFFWLFKKSFFSSKKQINAKILKMMITEINRV